MAKFISVILFMVLLVSCNPFPDFNPLEADEFYALDFTDDSYYKVTAELLAEGDKCVIWAEKGSGVDKETAKKIADKYDNIIRPKIVGAFGMKNITVEGNQFDDILDYANQLAGKNNKKITVLLLNIKDGFKDPAKDSYVAGYFFSGNFYPREYGGYSNGCDMIYVDTYPGLDPRQEEQTYATFAHELQHLINFATSVLLERKTATDTWIDEGLSSQAEHIYFEKNIADKCKWFSEDKNGTIAKGNNFFVWDNHGDNAILDEYATVYLFFRWLYLQAEADSSLKNTIFLDIETSGFSDYQVITNVAKNIRSEWANWDTLLGTWLAANYYPSNADYGYKDSFFYDDKINGKINENKIKVKPISLTSIPLYPGEGVYSNIKNSFTPPSTNGNIRYRGLNKTTSSNIETTPSFTTSDVLLTLNANTNNKSTSETGSLTGVSASVSSAANSRMIIEDAQPETSTGPYVIDARDLSERLRNNK